MEQSPWLLTVELDTTFVKNSKISASAQEEFLMCAFLLTYGTDLVSVRVIGTGNQVAHFFGIAFPSE